MPKHTLIKRSAIAAALAFSLYAPTSHANYSQLVIFGDSLSDTGNLASQINANPILSLLQERQAAHLPPIPIQLGLAPWQNPTD